MLQAPRSKLHIHSGGPQPGPTGSVNGTRQASLLQINLSISLNTYKV